MKIQLVNEENETMVIELDLDESVISDLKAMVNNKHPDLSEEESDKLFELCLKEALSQTINNFSQPSNNEDK